MIQFFKNRVPVASSGACFGAGRPSTPRRVEYRIETEQDPDVGLLLIRRCGRWLFQTLSFGWQDDVEGPATAPFTAAFAARPFLFQDMMLATTAGRSCIRQRRTLSCPTLATPFVAPN